VKLPDVWSRATPVFDDENLLSCAGLVPVMALAERAGLSELISERVPFTGTAVASAGLNPAGKLPCVHALLDGTQRRHPRRIEGAPLVRPPATT
jgi:hypothetical protein